MCAPISDGAAAAVLCTGEGLKRMGLDSARAIKVKAAILRSGTDRPPEDYKNHLTRLAALQAYEQAGLGPEDMSVAEVHDATAVGEVIQIENLGFVEFGEGGPASLRGETRIGGRIPVNPSGGLESKGHPVGATGIGQVLNWSHSCAAKPERARSKARKTPLPKTVAVCTASKKPPPVSPF